MIAWSESILLCIEIHPTSGSGSAASAQSMFGTTLSYTGLEIAPGKQVRLLFGLSPFARNASINWIRCRNTLFSSTYLFFCTRKVASLLYFSISTNFLFRCRSRRILFSSSVSSSGGVSLSGSGACIATSFPITRFKLLHLCLRVELRTRIWPTSKTMIAVCLCLSGKPSFVWDWTALVQMAQSPTVMELFKGRESCRLSRSNNLNRR